MRKKVFFSVSYMLPQTHLSCKKPTSQASYIRAFVFEVRISGISVTLNSKPQTPNPKPPKILKPETLNP